MPRRELSRQFAPSRLRMYHTHKRVVGTATSVRGRTKLDMAQKTPLARKDVHRPAFHANHEHVHGPDKEEQPDGFRAHTKTLTQTHRFQRHAGGGAQANRSLEGFFPDEVDQRYRQGAGDQVEEEAIL